MTRREFLKSLELGKTIVYKYINDIPTAYKVLGIALYYNNCNSSDIYLLAKSAKDNINYYISVWEMYADIDKSTGILTDKIDDLWKGETVLWYIDNYYAYTDRPLGIVSWDNYNSYLRARRFYWKQNQVKAVEMRVYPLSKEDSTKSKYIVFKEDGIKYTLPITSLEDGVEYPVYKTAMECSEANTVKMYLFDEDKPVEDPELVKARESYKEAIEAMNKAKDEYEAIINKTV